jgi:hypothetical protein
MRTDKAYWKQFSSYVSMHWGKIKNLISLIELKSEHGPTHNKI